MENRKTKIKLVNYKPEFYDMKRFGMINIHATNFDNWNQDGPLRSWRINVGVLFKSEVHFIFQVNFNRRDGSIYINFPYFQFTDGLASICTIPSGNGPHDVSLEDDAKVTSHLVKYSHPPSGEAHFSQTGKVHNQVRKQSIPLDKYNGHLFTCMIQDIHKFTKLTIKKEKNFEKKIPVYFKLANQHLPALKFVGHLYDLDYFSSNIIKGKLAPCVITQIPHGEPKLSMMCASPFGSPFDHKILSISCCVHKLLNNQEESALTFTGGFDEPDIALDKSKETSFLSLLYPVKNIVEMKKRLGSIDFRDSLIEDSIIDNSNQHNV